MNNTDNTASNGTKDNDKDSVYVEHGYVVEDEVSVFDEKEKEKVYEGAIVDTAKEMNAKVVVRSEEKLENGEQVELPLRVAYTESKVKLSRLPVWFLNALGSLSIDELYEFRDKYKDEISVNELAAINLLDGVLAKDKEAVATFWQIQQKMLQRTNVANQINISVKGKDNTVSRMLDEISDKIMNATPVKDEDGAKNQ